MFICSLKIVIMFDYVPHIFVLWLYNRHVEHCWRSKDKLTSDALQWTPTHGCASVDRLARTYLHQHCIDIEYSLENLLVVMDDRDRWREGQGISY